MSGSDRYNESGLAMCACGNKRVHAWEPGEFCSPQRVIPTATASEATRPATAHERNARDAVSVARIAREVRGMLADAPKGDPEVADILRDCEALDRAAQFLNTKPVEMKGGKLSLTTVAGRYLTPSEPEEG